MHVPAKRFDAVQRFEGNALRVGRKVVPARSLDCRI